MNDVCTYQIQLHGQAAQGDIESFSPPGLKLQTYGDSNTMLSVRTDQAGLIGLIRHLHGLGFVILSVACDNSDSAR